MIRPDGKRIFSFSKEFLGGSEIAEIDCWQRLKTLKIKVEIVNKPSKKGNSFFLSESNSYARVVILAIYLIINSLAAPLHAIEIQSMIYLSLMKKLSPWIK